MSADQIEQRVIQVLRQVSLSGSDREVGLREPLGELGVGLDSLALVEFVTALEKQFHIQVPDDIWTTRGQLTLGDFVEIIAGAVSSPLPSATDSVQPPAVVRAPGDIASRTGEAEQPGQRQRHWRQWRVVQLLNRAAHRLHDHAVYHVLEFDLSAQPLPTYSSPLKLTFRPATMQDAAALMAFWESFDRCTFNKEPMTLPLFETLLRSGHTCLVAWLEGKVVAMDWISERGFRCRYTGLRLEWPHDTCYAGELWEPALYQGKGVGLALLAHSLGEARKKGYLRQVCWVDAGNARMLAAAIQLFGFRIVGEIRTTNVFKRPFSTWRVDGRSGRGGTARL